MFAKLKKKIEEEVGDLGQLTSPMANPFGSGDRRVGGSTQGTNTPNNLGSRQSSLASLVDLNLHSHEEPTSPIPPGMSTTNNLSVPLTPVPAAVPRPTNHSTPGSTPRQKGQELEAELKKVNSEWMKKFDSMKKSFEERLQNQEADFAWKYSSKEEELERVRAEKRKADELVRTMEGSYQNKMTRVQDDMDQLEGFTKQEMAKVKHLLLNTQADLQKSQSDLIDRGNVAKELTEENRQLKSENESILRNLDRDRLNRVKFEAEHGDTIAQISNLQRENTQLQQSLSDFQRSSEESTKQLLNTQADLQKSQSDLIQQVKISDELLEEKKRLKADNDSISRSVDRDEQNRVQLEAQYGPQISNLQRENTQLQQSLSDFQRSSEESTKQLLNTQADLQKSQSDLIEQGNVAKELTEENRQLKSENESILRNLDRDRLNRVKFETEHGDAIAQISNLQRENTQLQQSLSDLLRSSEDSTKQLLQTQADLRKAQSDLIQQVKISDELLEEKKRLKADNDSISRSVDRDEQNRVQLEAQYGAQISNLQREIQLLQESLSDFQRSSEESTKQLLNTQVDLQKSQSDLIEQGNVAKELTEENRQLKSENESILRNLDRDRLERVKFETEHGDTIAQIRNLQRENTELQQSLSDLQRSSEESTKQLLNTQADLRKPQSDLIQQVKISENGKDEDEDVESYKERIRELEAKLSDKNKALKLRQQQLQDLRKTLAKEMKGNSSSAQLQPSEPSELFSKSPSQNSLASSANDVRVEEMSQTDTEPAVIPSSNSHLDASRTYAEDVNFQYLKTVVFKFVTSPDPQVTQHLTKVVSTLLHLSDEEARILEKCTDKRLLTWLGTREHQPY